MLCTLDYSFRRQWGPGELDSAHYLLCKHTGPHLLKVCTCVTTHLLTGPTNDCVCQQVQWDHWARLPSWTCPTSAVDQKVVGGVSANVCISSWNVIYLSWMCSGFFCSIFSTCAALGTNAAAIVVRRRQRCQTAYLAGQKPTQWRRIISMVTAGSTSSLK